MSLYGTTTAATYAKDVWLPGFNNQFESEPGTLLNLFGIDARTMEVLQGRQALLKIRVGDSKGSGALTEQGDYPSAGDLTAAEAKISAAHLAHAINWSSEEIGYLNSGDAAAAPIVAEKFAVAEESMRRYTERQAWQDGTFLANVASSSGSTITLDATTTDQHDRDRYIWIDDANRNFYDVVHGTTGAQQVTKFSVTDVAESTNILTCDQTMTSATAAGVVVVSGNWASAGAFRSLEFQGIQAMVDDTNTYEGINRSTAGNGFWKSTVVTNSGTLRSLTEDLIHTLLNRMARRNASGKQPVGNDYMGFASMGTWTAYHQIMSPGLRYTANDKPNIGWGDPLPMLGVDLYRDVHCPRSTIFVLHKPSIHFVRPKYDLPYGDTGLFTFLKDPGGNMFFIGTASSGRGHSSQFFSYLDGFCGLMTDRPRNHGVLRDITETAV